ncbi:MAG: DUF6599 family protein [Desulfobacterales bacterium]
MILALLAVIAIGVYWRHLEFNPAVQALETIRQAPQIDTVRQEESVFPLIPPDRFSIFSPPETFNQMTLSDKINGKAELYLPAGFENLYAQRLAPRNFSDVWYEVFIYDMGNRLNAFSVYSAQRREDAEPETFAEFAYHAGNALFWVHGPYYVEIIASEVSDKTREHLLSLAEAFNSQNPISAESIDEIELFPKKNLVQYSIRFIPANAFGFEGLDRIFAATYRFDNDQLTAFISKRKSSEEALQKAEEFIQFLITYGGIDISRSIDGLDVKMVDFFGTFEAALTAGPYLAGVHEAANPEDAIRLVQAIYEKLQRK